VLGEDACGTAGTGLLTGLTEDGLLSLPIFNVNFGTDFVKSSGGCT
jgi:hypothetical protein